MKSADVMAKAKDAISGGSHLVVFRSLRNKLLTLMIALSLLPLAGIATFSNVIGSRQIAEDRIKLALETMAQDTADKIDIMLSEKKQESHSMGTTLPLISQSLGHQGLIQLLNNYCFNNEGYDLLIVLDAAGQVIGINTTDRDGTALPAAKVSQILKSNISAFPEEAEMFGRSITGHSWHHDWYASKLVHSLYDFTGEDLSRQYNIALSEPIQNPTTHELVGVWISIINWDYFQKVLDNVETDLANLNLRTGYAFMFAKDADTIIAHKYRSNRISQSPAIESPETPSLYNAHLVDLGLRNLHDAVLGGQRSYAYEFPKGNRKISGMSPIDDSSFGWTVGVGIDNADIFRPIRSMTYWLIAVALALGSLVVLFTFVIAQGITVPLKNLIQTAQRIAQGNLSERVLIRTSDEVGILGATFNDMARSLEAREEELQELNKNLEDMVRQRTLELETSHEALKKAYTDLQSAQDQLIQTEKMASLGQLVAGIAHEIKNPLNFIYGNTGFLAEYVRKLQFLIDCFETLPSLSPEDRTTLAGKKQEVNYEFIREDLHTLIDNFTEGARRINTIVSDLRTFSRIDKGVVSEIDLHASLEMSLNLLSNQYKSRIEVHREYGEIPKIVGYSGKLSQVFMNLLSNAFHAIKDRGDVWIRTRRRDGTVEVEIEDNGVGIPRENLNRIFEPFYTTKPVGQGTGLGLSISYGIIEQHHGKIQVASTPQKGTIFTVRLPVALERSA
jgi:two-component system, NtrC family, sensor kinase